MSAASPLLDDMEAGELHPPPPPPRVEEKINWRFWVCVAIVVLVTVLFAAAVVVVLSLNPGTHTPTMSIEDIFDLEEESPDYKFVMGSNEQFTYLNDTCLMMQNAVTGDRRCWLNGTTLADQFGLGSPVEWVKYSVSPLARYVLFATEVEQKWRHSFQARFLVYDTTKDILFNLSETSSQTKPYTTKQQFAIFSPSTSESSVVFARHNDLYVVRLTDAATVETRITFDGDNDKNGDSILEGVPDWVSQEEILESDTAVWWSPNGRQLSFARFDQALVPTTTLPNYDFSASTTPQLTFRYPCPGDALSTTSVVVWDSLDAGNLKTIPLSDGYVYLSGLLWVNDTNFVFVELTRNQQNAQYMLANQDGTTALLTTMQVGDGSWIDPPSSLTYLPAPHHAIVDLWPAGDFMSFLYLPLDNPTPRLLAQKADVTAIVGYRASSGQLVYQSASPRPMDREVFVVPFGDVPAGGNLGQPTAILGGQQWGSGTLSPGGDWLITHSSTMQVPTNHSVFDMSAMSSKSNLEDNAWLKGQLAARLMPTMEFFSFTPSYPDAPVLNGWVAYPPGVSKDSAPTHPALIYVYGGPGSQTVQNMWSMDWPFLLASTYDCIAVSIDGRGTGARGQAFKNQVKGRLGVLETEDLMELARELTTWRAVDKSRISVFGWSFGGFMTLRTVSSATREILRAAVAVAPVSDWHYYDASYTERYMGLPSDNPAGYAASSIVEPPRALNLSTGPNFLLGFGSGDDNVHPQNSMLVIRRQIENSASNMVTQIFPNDQHSINLPHSRIYVWRLLTRYLIDQLELAPHKNAPTSVPRRGLSGHEPQ
ncbi:dipeptidyl peptidase IV (CD26) [Paratrimastix pyriformis]|uniref:Dipeptidyl peptidase IV (CD26) n=1 Tax=Paratrimastix pyriformis TaxID=342808 RepID=A0ABQ8UBU6_9EUKA|nr:dipeptidyl peptidase IV (CD26) [Paratrimastix pyriformis]